MFDSLHVKKKITSAWTRLDFYLNQPCDILSLRLKHALNIWCLFMLEKVKNNSNKVHFFYDNEYYMFEKIRFRMAQIFYIQFGTSKLRLYYKRRCSALMTKDNFHNLFTLIKHLPIKVENQSFELLPI